MSNNLPWVSVITPAYNQAAFLRDTIESVLSQDYPHIELIVINDGSTDDTEKILQEYSGRIKWLSHQNMGQTATINKGWKMATGSILTWLNSDDTYLPGAVRAGVNYLLEHPETSIVFADSMYTRADGTHLERTRPVPPFNYKKFLVNCENPISQPSSFIRREVIEKTGELDAKFYYFMDWDYWLRAGLNFNIEHTSAIWSTYRLHADSKTVSQSKKAAPELQYMYEKFFSRNDLPSAIRRLRKKAMMNMYFTSGNYYMLGNDRKASSQMAGKAIRHNPLTLFSPKTLHKYLFCKFGHSRFYKGLKTLFGVKTKVELSG